MNEWSLLKVNISNFLSTAQGRFMTNVNSEVYGGLSSKVILLMQNSTTKNALDVGRRAVFTKCKILQLEVCTLQPGYNPLWLTGLKAPTKCVHYTQFV